MEININEMRHNQMDGEYVWITDFRYNDYSNKPIRHIKPQKVLIRSNTKTNKKIYYSESHFVGLKRNGEPLKTGVIPFFDNTGFRSFTGTSVKVFTTEREAERKYDNFRFEVVKGLNDYRNSITDKIDAIIREIKGN